MPPAPPPAPLAQQRRAILDGLDRQEGGGEPPVWKVAPLERAFLVDTLAPLALYDRLRTPGKLSLLLESVEGGERWGRHSFMGLGALACFEGRAGELRLESAAQTRTFSAEPDPTRALAALLQQASVCALDGRFPGGAVGYLSYDAARWFEPSLGPSDSARLRFVVPEVLLRFDGLSHRASLVALADLTHAARARHAGLDTWQTLALRALDEAQTRLDAVEARLGDPSAGRLRTPAPLVHPARWSPDSTSGLPLGVETSLTREAFCARVERCKSYIQAGDIIQAVLSQRLRLSAQEVLAQGDALDVYRRLRLINPSPYLFLLELGDETLLGSSPEVMVRKVGARVEVRPIAGTRKRGRDEAHDKALEAELRADPKERAEHIMLLDLGRNDIGRVSEVGSVEVREQLVVERYSHVMHLVSHVQGQLKQGLGWRDALASTFPAGTLSGAPKVRAMQIIEELEPTPRGVYGGAVGYIGLDGDMDLCIAIRTLHLHDGFVDLQAGAGVVADSDPQLEWQETLNKAAALLASVLPSEPSP